MSLNRRKGVTPSRTKRRVGICQSLERGLIEIALMRKREETKLSSNVVL